jgi:nicotinate-nucleotide pyrophosphorylase (carboxylating)
MTKDFCQLEWNEQLADDCRQILRLGVREDFNRSVDLTTLAVVPAERTGSAAVVARQAGVIAGLPAVQLLIDEMNLRADWEAQLDDGQSVQAGQVAGRLTGPVRDLLAAERLLLNLLGRLCGIATLTRRYVDAVQHLPVRIHDTRKTTPGWRRLEKYAVRCGGGHNHRTGLFDAVLIKDNHLAQAADGPESISPGEAVRIARQFVEANIGDSDQIIVEVEVDTLDQLDQVLPKVPDIVLLDNMAPDELRTAVQRRDAAGVPTELEASGGITLEALADVAATGVERISIGALTHSAIALDLALDWEREE